MNLEELNSNLIKACLTNARNVTNIVNKYLTAGANVNAQARDTLTTPLMSASFKNNIDVVNILINYGANLNMRDINGNTALILACENGYFGIVDRLIQKTPDINIQNIQGINALMMACKSGNLRIVKRLLELPNININARDFPGDTALIFACRSDKVDIVKLLLETGRVDINAQDQYGLTALCFSIGKFPITQILVENGANLNGYSNNGFPLFDSIYLQDNITIQYLIKHGANVNVEYTDYRVNDNTRTPLMYAVQNNNIDKVKILLDAGANPEYQSSDGLTAKNLSDNPIITEFFTNRNVGGKRKSKNKKTHKKRKSKNKKTHKKRK